MFDEKITSAAASQYDDMRPELLFKMTRSYLIIRRWGIWKNLDWGELSPPPPPPPILPWASCRATHNTSTRLAQTVQALIRLDQTDHKDYLESKNPATWSYGPL